MKNAYSRLKTAIFSVLDKLLEKYTAVERIYVTGHSLGGALATMFAKAIYEHLPQINKERTIALAGYTFGGYSIGNMAFKADFDKKVPDFFRCVNDKDVIPHINSPLFGYEHVGKLCHMTSENLFFDMENFHIEEASSCADGVGEYLADHGTTKYWGLVKTYDALASLKPEEDATVEKAWRAFMGGSKTRLRGAIATEGGAVVYARSLEPDLDAAYECLLADIAANPIRLPAEDAERAVTKAELDMCIRQSAKGSTNKLEYSNFVVACFRCIYDKRDDCRSRTVDGASIRAAFNEYDRDFDGFLNKAEFESLCDDKYGGKDENRPAEAFMEAVDMDKNGFISDEEFLVYVRAARKAAATPTAAATGGNEEAANDEKVVSHRGPEESPPGA